MAVSVVTGNPFAEFWARHAVHTTQQYWTSSRLRFIHPLEKESGHVGPCYGNRIRFRPTAPAS